MAYVKNIWVDGDTITSELLNHIEDGIANCGSGTGNLVLKAVNSSSGGQDPLRSTRQTSSEDIMLNVTYNQMMTVLRNGGRLVAIAEQSGKELNFIHQIYMDDVAEVTENPTWLPFNVASGSGDDGSIKGESKKSSGFSYLDNFPELCDGYFIGADYIMYATTMSSNAGDLYDPIDPTPVNNVNDGNLTKGETKDEESSSGYPILEPTYYFASKSPDSVMILTPVEELIPDDSGQGD